MNSPTIATSLSRGAALRGPSSPPPLLCPQHGAPAVPAEDQRKQTVLEAIRARNTSHIDNMDMLLSRIDCALARASGTENLMVTGDKRPTPFGLLSEIYDQQETMALQTAALGGMLERLEAIA